MKAVRVLRQYNKNTKVLMSNGSTRMFPNNIVKGLIGKSINEIDVSKLTFGIELEFSAPKKKIVSSFCRAFLKVVEQDKKYIKNRQYDEWVLIRDASVEGAFDSLELQSPKLSIYSFEEEIIKYLKVLLKLREQGFLEVNKTCGYHLHIGGLSLKQAEEFRKFYRHNYSIFDMFQPEDRRSVNNKYCPNKIGSPYSHYQKISLARYHKAKNEKISVIKTIENRHHFGTVSIEDVINWIYFNIALIILGNRKIFSGVEEFLRSLVLTEKQRFFYYKRYYELNFI